MSENQIYEKYGVKCNLLQSLKICKSLPQECRENIREEDYFTLLTGSQNL